MTVVGGGGVKIFLLYRVISISKNSSIVGFLCSLLFIIYFLP